MSKSHFLWYVNVVVNVVAHSQLSCRALTHDAPSSLCFDFCVSICLVRISTTTQYGPMATARTTTSTHTHLFISTLQLCQTLRHPQR